MRTTLTAALLLGMLTGAHAQVTYTPSGVPAGGSIIQNVGVLTGTDDDGTPLSLTSNTVNASVTQIAGVDIKPDSTDAAPSPVITISPDQIAEFVFTLTNTGNGTDTFNLSFDSRGYQAPVSDRVFLDSNRNGMIDGTESEVTSVQLAPGEDVSLISPTDRTSGSAAAAGTAHNFTLRAVSLLDNSVTDTAVAQRINSGSAAHSLSSGIIQAARLNIPVTWDFYIYNDGNTDLDENFRITATSEPAISSRYDMGYGVFNTPQEAFNSYLSVNPGGIPPQGSAVLFVISTLLNANGGSPAVTTLNSHTEEPAPAGNAYTQTSPLQSQHGLFLGTAVLVGNKEQSLCSVETDGTILCGPTTRAPLQGSPCSLIYYRVRAESNGTVGIGDLTLRDPVSPQLNLLWARASTFYMSGNATETFPGYGSLKRPGLISVNGGPLISGSTTLQGEGTEIRAYPSDASGNPGELGRQEELWLELFTQIPGTNCTVPTTPYEPVPAQPLDVINSERKWTPSSGEAS